jgi:hypothetical protein
MAIEWETAENDGRAPNWGLFTNDYISGFCQKVATEHPGWHSDLYALDLSSYMISLPKKKLWWLPELQAVEEITNSTSHLSNML